MKIVINTCFGGFELSDIALKELNIEYGDDIKRNDPGLVEIVERLGRESWGSCARLRIVEIPNAVKWTIIEYDGVEYIAEEHRTWGQ